MTIDKEFACSDPGVNIFYYHRLIGDEDSKKGQATLPDPPGLIQGNELLCLPGKSGIANQCANSQPRRHWWLTSPTASVPKVYQNVGFLTQLSLLCAAAKLQKCQNGKCAETFCIMEKEAPPCSWGPFREWALVAMSCQETLAQISRESLSLGLARFDKMSRPHTHLVNAVHGCYQILENTSQVQDLFGTAHDGFPAPALDLREICNIIYWMANIQAFKNVGTAMLRRWDHHYLPSLVTGPAIRRASQKILSLELCCFRFWNLVDLAERKESDLPDIVDTLDVDDRRRALRHDGHGSCAATKCQYSHKDSTKVGQLHICESDCGRYNFPMEELGEALELGDGTAWSREVQEPHLIEPNKPYIAISHVWADGTGVGVQSQGTVNKCLFDYFSRIAESLGCDGIWWDALSIPSEPKVRSKAIERLHKNYSTAEYTVVHDLYLLNIEFKDPATACLAIVLSPWFTRGWTALELRMSTRVKVLFKGSSRDKPAIKDLDDDILAKGPGPVSRAHWLASTIISRLRTSEISYIDDILAILRPRSTSWVRDRTVIAALLTGLPRCDYSRSEGEITRDIISYLGFVPYSSLLHGRPTMFAKGPFSWCPATLDDMPIDLCLDLDNHEARRARLLRVENGGAVVGAWHCELVTEQQMKRKKLQPHGDHISVAVAFQNALLEWQNCLILRERKTDAGPALLVTTVASTLDNGTLLLECNYVGAARVAENDDEQSAHDVSDSENDAFSQEVEVRIGLESKRPECRARDVIKKWLSMHASLVNRESRSSSAGDAGSGLGRKHAGDSGDQDKRNDVKAGWKAAHKNQNNHPWYLLPGIGHYLSQSNDENQEMASDSDEEASEQQMHERLSRVFRNANATEILHLLVHQGIEIPSGVLNELSFCQLGALSFVYFANNLSKEAIETSERAADMLPTVTVAGDLAKLEVLCVLGKVSWKTKKIENANRFYQTLIDSCDSRRTQEQQWKWRAHGELSLLLAELNQLTRASECQRQALEEFKRLPTPEDIFGYDAPSRLQIPYSMRDTQNKTAETVYKEALSVLERYLSKEHAIVFTTAKGLASVFFNQGDISAAEEILFGILPRLEKLAGPSHLLTLRTRYDLTRIQAFQRKITNPNPMLALIEDLKRHLGPEHWLTRLAALAVAGFYFMKKQFQDAIPFLNYGKQASSTKDASQAFVTACARRDLGMVHSMLGDVDIAREEYQIAIEDQQRLHHPEHLEVYATLFCMGTVKDAMKDYSVAEKGFSDSIRGLERLCGPPHPETREIVSKLAWLCAKSVLEPGYDDDFSNEHITRALYGLKVLLERCGDVPGSKGRVKWALPDFKEFFGTDSNDSGLPVDQGVNSRGIYLAQNEILVQNKAIGLSEDIMNRQDIDSDKEDNLGRANDVSGVVVRVGSREGLFKEGDRVLGHAIYAASKDQRHAGFQHHTVLLTQVTARIPRTLSFDRAAALPSSTSTAAAALFSKGYLGLDAPSMPFKPPGNNALIVWGGTTSVGCCAIQLAVAAGLKVIATALPKDFDYVRGVGATTVVDSSTPTVVDDLRKASNGKQVVGALDAIGSQETMDICHSVPNIGVVFSARDIKAANIIDDDKLSRCIYEQFLPVALAEGRYICAPEPNVNIRTTAVQASLEAHRKVVIVL